MEAKLTIKLERNIIEKAKSYAKEKNTSLSKMIENILSKITAEKEDKMEISPLVKGLSGIIYLPENYDYKKEYAGYLVNKYK